MNQDYRNFAQTELAAAVDLGDIRENAEFDSAVWHQNHLAAMIAELRYALNSQIVFIEDLKINPKKVSIRTKVTLIDTSDDNKEEYIILGPYEADVTKGFISYLSPLAKMLIGKGVGDTVTLGEGTGTGTTYKISAIEEYKIED